MFSSCQGPRTAEHVVIPPPLSIYALFHNTHTLARAHTRTHIHRLLSFPLALGLERDLDLIAEEAL